jgi:signal transduction histidine kinase
MDLHHMDGVSSFARSPIDAETASDERTWIIRLHDAGIAAMATGEPGPLFLELLDALETVTRATCAIALQKDQASNELRVLAPDVPSPLMALCAPGAELHALFVAALMRREPVFADDIRRQATHSAHARQGLRLADVMAWHATPLVARNGESLGLTFLGFRRPHRLAERQRSVVDRLSRHAADFIDQARARRALEERCAREEAARVHADAANLRKDQFLATLSHEIRQPLAAALPAFEVHRLGNDEASRRRASEVLGHQLTHISKLIEDLNDVWHISRGTLELHRERLDLRGILEEAIDMAKPLLDRRQHTLFVDLGAEPTWVSADGTRLKQVFSNLLRNAAWYTPAAGRIRMTLNVHDGSALCCVADNGVGINPDALNRVFDLFERGDAGSHAGSFGIGLAVVRQVVTLHGGEVSARSGGRGLGSEFVVRLPCAPRMPS